MTKIRQMSTSRAERPARADSASGALRRLSLGLAVAAVLAAPQTSLAQQAPICVDPPPIGGAPSVGAAPAGWSVAANTPDIIAGNGPWPGGGYTVSDVGGASTSGGTMGLFLGEPPNYVESWQTTLTGLTAGVTYQVAVEWQQATLAQNGGGGIEWHRADDGNRNLPFLTALLGSGSTRGNMCGTFPQLVLSGPDGAGCGGWWIPTTSVATLAKARQALL